MEEMLLNKAAADSAQGVIDFCLIADLVIFVLLTIVFFRLLDCFNAKLKKSLEEKDSSIVRFLPVFERIAKGLVLFFVIATFLQSHGYSMASLIAGFGITGLAVGFAAKETIAGAFGAIAILADKSFQLGDYIIVGAVEGTVEDINMRSTKLRAPDGSIIIIPNNVMVSAIIKNTSAPKKAKKGK